MPAPGRDPECGGSEAERLRDHLEQAGLLAEPAQRRRRPPRDKTADARVRAGYGTTLADIVTEGR